MAIISCPECKKDISDSALTCPGCGRPMRYESISARESLASFPSKRKSRRPSLVKIVVIGVFVWIAGSAYLKTMLSSNTTDMAMQALTDKQQNIRSSAPKPRTAESSTAADGLPHIPIEEYVNSLNLGWYGGRNKISFDTAPSPTGAPACNVYINPGRNTKGQMVAIRNFSDKKSLDVTLFKSSWKLPENSIVPVGIESEGVKLMAVQGHGSSQVINFHVPIEHVSALYNHLLESPSISFVFPEGSESEWKVSMEGVGQYMRKMNICAMRTLLKNPSTQPL